MAHAALTHQRRGEETVEQGIFRPFCLFKADDAVERKVAPCVSGRKVIRQGAIIVQIAVAGEIEVIADGVLPVSRLPNTQGGGSLSGEVFTIKMLFDTVHEVGRREIGLLVPPTVLLAVFSADGTTGR